ncbi:MAG: 50S ribosomal protein L18e [Candidatus Woesearchaeota archaeon]|nr:MAG: 50S ribosomal protein L18e [Candidatus Woesearchaeota archaeon]
MSLEHKNERLKELISSLKKQSIEQKTNIWKRIALELEKPTRHHRIVNLSKIDKNTKDNDIVIIPGKLLSGGELNKKVTIIAYSYSKNVLDKINGKASILSIEEAMKKFPNGKNIKIIG